FEQLDHSKLEDEVFDRDRVSDLPQLHETDCIDNAALLRMLNMDIEVRLESILLAGRNVNERVRFVVIGETARNDVNVKVDPTGQRIRILEPKCRGLRLDEVFRFKRFSDIVIDILERLARARVVTGEIADDIEVVRVA